MALKLSSFGERFTRPTGALELMDDLGLVMSGERPALMMGGGNPGKIPEVQDVIRRRLREIAESPEECDRLVGNYAHPRGELTFRRSLARLLAREYGWPLTEDNIALTAGSQAGFFLLFNLLAGEFSDKSKRRILLPMTPEYVGYADVGLSDDFFRARRPAIEELEDNLFKYHVDFGRLEIGADIGAVCVSRPTNPTGNVITDQELERLDAMCRASRVPLIVDAAYGVPFPGIVFTEAAPLWNENVILCMSLSKVGLPGVRTGIVVGSEEVVAALTSMTAVLNLAIGSVGPVLTQPLVESGEIIDLSRRCIGPFYRDKAFAAVEWLGQTLRGVPFRIHKPEGAMFLWLWLPGLPITSAELYRRLKDQDLFVLSGHYFFPGLDEPWQHRNECLRLSFAEDAASVKRGIEVLAGEIKRAFDGSARAAAAALGPG
jgi:valine--pyruvate aminotransferase